MLHSGCALVWHFNLGFIVFECQTHYCALSTYCKSGTETSAIKTLGLGTQSFTKWNACLLYTINPKNSKRVRSAGVDDRQLAGLAYFARNEWSRLRCLHIRAWHGLWCQFCGRSFMWYSVLEFQNHHNIPSREEGFHSSITGLCKKLHFPVDYRCCWWYQHVIWSARLRIDIENLCFADKCSCCRINFRHTYVLCTGYIIWSGQSFFRQK